MKARNIKKRTALISTQNCKQDKNVSSWSILTFLQCNRNLQCTRYTEVIKNFLTHSDARVPLLRFPQTHFRMRAIKRTYYSQWSHFYRRRRNKKKNSSHFQAMKVFMFNFYKLIVLYEYFAARKLIIFPPTNIL